MLSEKDIDLAYKVGGINIPLKIESTKIREKDLEKNPGKTQYLRVEWRKEEAYKGYRKRIPVRVGRKSKDNVTKVEGERASRERDVKCRGHFISVRITKISLLHTFYFIYFPTHQMFLYTVHTSVSA